MFSYIIWNSKLTRNPQNTCKHHKTKMTEIDTKLAALLLKLHDPNKCGLVHLVHGLNVPRPPFDALNDL